MVLSPAKRMARDAKGTIAISNCRFVYRGAGPGLCENDGRVLKMVFDPHHLPNLGIRVVAFVRISYVYGSSFSVLICSGNLDI